MGLNLKTIAEWARGKITDKFGGVVITSVSTDTRTLTPGSLFVGIKGHNFDGNNFLDEAFAQGAAAALTSNAEKLGDRAGIVVDDPVRALGDFAARYRWERCLIPWAGITGTNGKTTTQRLLTHILQTVGKVCTPTANYNNFIGLPLTILTNDAETKFGVLEMGTSAPGEIRRLAEIAMPTVAAITNVSAGHLLGLNSVDGVAREKQEIFRFLANDGLAVFPAQSPYANQFRNAVRRGVAQITFGIDTNADVVATNVVCDNRGCSFKIGAQDFFLPLLGRHNVENCLIALIAARRFGVSFAQAAESITSFTSVSGRLQVTQLHDLVLIDDTYNANPASMRAAAQVLLDYPARRRVLIIGDMLELGAQSQSLHTELGKWLATTELDNIIAIGKEMFGLVENLRTVRQDVKYYPTVQALLPKLKTMLKAGDVVLLKGSRIMRLDRVAEVIRKYSSLDFAN